jgi:hypothetical protein
MDAPDPICPRCSKPIVRGNASQFAGRPVHMRCLASQTRLAALEQQVRAREARLRALAVTERVRALIDGLRDRQTRCPVCQAPLAERDGLLFQGDKLVHADCWRADPKPVDDPPPA